MFEGYLRRWEDQQEEREESEPGDHQEGITYITAITDNNRRHVEGNRVTEKILHGRGNRMIFKFKRKSDGKIFFTNGRIYSGRGTEEHYYLTSGSEKLQVTELNLINNFVELEVIIETI